MTLVEGMSKLGKYFVKVPCICSADPQAGIHTFAEYFHLYPTKSANSFAVEQTKKTPSLWHIDSPHILAHQVTPHLNHSQ